MGFDVHIMVVPSGNGTTTVPLPHPFIGKLEDKLSKDVKIRDKACATKDSVAKHDDTMHMQQWAIGSWGILKSNSDCIFQCYQVSQFLCRECIF